MTSLQYFNWFVWGLSWLLFKRGVDPDQSAQVIRTTKTQEPNPGVSGGREKFDDQGQAHAIYTNAAIYLRPSGGTKCCNRLTSQGCGTKRGLRLHHTVTMGRQFLNNYQSCWQRDPQCFPFHYLNTVLSGTAVESVHKTSDFDSIKKAQYVLTF
jgi:hypothetical protein